MSMMLAATAMSKRKKAGWMHWKNAIRLFEVETGLSYYHDGAISGYTLADTVGGGDGSVYAWYNKTSGNHTHILAKWTAKDGTFVKEWQTAEFKRSGGTLYIDTGYRAMRVFPESRKLVLILNVKHDTYSGDDVRALFIFTASMDAPDTPVQIWSDVADNDDISISMTRNLRPAGPNSFAFWYTDDPAGESPIKYYRCINLSGGARFSWSMGSSSIQGVAGVVGNENAYDIKRSSDYWTIDRTSAQADRVQVYKEYFSNSQLHPELQEACPCKYGLAVLARAFNNTAAWVYVFDNQGNKLAKTPITLNQYYCVGADEDGNAVFVDGANKLYNLVLTDGVVSFEPRNPEVTVPNRSYQWGIGIESVSAYSKWPNG